MVIVTVQNHKLLLPLLQEIHRDVPEYKLIYPLFCKIHHFYENLAIDSEEHVQA